MASRLDSEFGLAHCVIDGIFDKAITLGTHKEGDWRQLTDNALLTHADAHFMQIISYDQDDDHLANCICRLLMVLQRREERKQLDNP